ncbi:MAG: hypothetical protein WCI04_01180 [archaeon]
MTQNETKICSCCGQPIYTCKELEKKLGTPIIFIFEQYELWKKLNDEKTTHPHPQEEPV